MIALGERSHFFDDRGVSAMRSDPATQRCILFRLHEICEIGAICGSSPAVLRDGRIASRLQ